MFLEETLKKLFTAVAASLLIAGSAAAHTVTVAIGADPVTFDIHRTNDQPTSQVARQIYDTLVVQTEDLELAPGLAESWQQTDDVTWVFNLRKGVKWHNGDAFTAHDVVWTYDRSINLPSTTSYLLGGIVTGIEALDDHTLQLTLDYPYAPLLNNLAHSALGIMNEAAVTAAGDDYGTAVVVGTGPFKFESWTTADRLTLSRNDSWWGGDVKPASVVFRPIPDNTVRSIELETGGVDIAYTLAPSDARRVKETPFAHIVPVETLSTAYIGFNFQKAPFDNQLVRQAINHAIDVDLIAETIYTGQAVRANSPISNRVFGANTGLEPYAYDQERAKELLAEAGFPAGFSTTLWTNENPQRMQIAEIVQAELANIGVQVDVEVVEWGTYLADTAAGLHDMFILGWVTVTGDADYGLYALFHSSQFGDPGNRTFYASDRVDELLDAGRRATDPAEREAIYFEAQEIIRDEAPWLFLIVTTEEHGVRNDITGFVPHPAGHHRLYDVVKD
jgi:peptide/nickel transport system substrate-binding protein